MTENIAIVGAGLVGCMLGCLLARRGHNVTIFEKRNIVKSKYDSAKRSTHLVVSKRGWKALDAVGASKEVITASLPLTGRRVHLENGHEEFLPYGRADQTIFAIHRHTLNKILLNQCRNTLGVDIRFDERCVDIDLTTGTLEILRGSDDQSYYFHADRVFGADGAFSDVKRIIANISNIAFHECFETYGYKELTIKPRYSSHLKQDAMHAWPRGEISLFAFPNKDSSFTATLIAPLNDEGEFKDVDTVEAFEYVMSRLFPDIKSGPMIDDFLENPVSKLFSSNCSRWNVNDRVVLIGDAAHAMVPFLGQGMNAGFEDCMTIIDLLNEHNENFSTVVRKFEYTRKADCDAITKMSADNFHELTCEISDKQFIQKKALEMKVQRLYPDRYTPQYELIAFSDIPYGEVLRRSKELNSITSKILEHTDDIYFKNNDELDHLIQFIVNKDFIGDACETNTH